MGRRRERLGWYCYDWANSAFSTTVVTVFLGPYLTTAAKAAGDAEGWIFPLGLRVAAGAFFPYVVSLSVLLQVLVLPVLGAIADYSKRKKELMGLFAYVGAAATAGMGVVPESAYLLVGGLFLVANVSFGASVVFYNAFLPEIAPPGERDAVSSRGWALGYLGGGVLLAANLAFVARAGDFGLTLGDAVRISLTSAGLWWGLFTLVPMATLETREPVRRIESGKRYFSVGFTQLRETLVQLGHDPNALRFLLAYLLYNDGIQTVITLASQFGQEELGLPVSTLTAVILMVQFVAFAGSLAFGRLAGVLGTKRALVTSLLVWIAAILYAYGLMRTGRDFVVLAAAIGIVLGGSQALSRSAYSSMIPKGREAEYFGLYEVSERGTSWLGPLLYGLTLQLTGNYRTAILSVAVFFVLGLALLLRVHLSPAAGEEDVAAEASAGRGKGDVDRG